MTFDPEGPLVVNGWILIAHPLFLDAVELLAAEVEALARKDPSGYTKRAATKRLAAINRLIFEVIPADPLNPAFRLGHTLGSDNSGWFRAKFFQQYRLFFRFHSEMKVIVYAWVNDNDTLRAYDSDSDAYRTFQRMLASGNPPTDWEALLREARSEVRPLR